MNYQQTLDYLFAQLPMFQRIGAAAYKADLGNTIEMCRLLGNPEKNFRSVHIAGTNGKGSTSHLIASVLQSAGYKTGLFTSPHLKDFRERIKINGKKIPKAYVTSFVSKNRNIFEQIKPSFFEYTAVMAFHYFSEEKVDIAILETGMGGRLDSTNVVTPVISVITNISKDHTTFLGNTIKEIAIEKAGIIKNGVPVIIGETQKEVEGIFIKIARKLNTPILFADQNFRLITQKNQFLINGDLYPRDGVPGDGVPLNCPLKGLYQQKNIITAYQSIQLLLNEGYRISLPEIHKGFKNVIMNTGFLGRWQRISIKPRAICDVGHNEAGIRYILEQLESEKFSKLHWVFGLVNDKDADSILEMLPKEALYYFCKANIPRGLDVEELKKKAFGSGLVGDTYPSVKIAYQNALEAAGEGDLVIVAGSTFVVAEVL